MSLSLWYEWTSVSIAGRVSSCMLNRYNIVQFRVNFPKGPSILCIKRQIQCSTLINLWCSAHLWQMCYKLLWCSRLLWTCLTNSHLCYSFSPFPRSNLLQPPRRKGLSAVCLCRLGDKKQQRPNIFFILFFPHKRKSEIRERTILCAVPG